MATFLIHEDHADVLKENACMPLRNNKALSNAAAQLQQQQRKTFGVLNNVQLGARAQSQKTTSSVAGAKPLAGVQLSAALQAGKTNDENAVHRQQLQLAAQNLNKIVIKPTVVQQLRAPAAPVDNFKAFAVYEDDKALRDQHHLETPMSVGGGDLQSPMSVDKSLTESSGAPSSDALLEQQLAAMRAERDRFFDVREYQRDILEYLRDAERKHLPKYGYMRKQPDINHSMRTILVDWLVEVCEEYRLQSETLCLAVSYIDRFLSTMSVVRAKLQLVGTAAMFIAAKYEEIYPPDVNEFVYITDHTYTKKQVLRMEQLILKVLTFDLFVPTTTTFVNLYVTMNPQDERVKHLSAYLCELALLEADPYLQYVPSLIAAGAMAMARYTVGLPMWTARLENQCGYSLDQLRDVLFHLARTASNAAGSGQQAIQDKYKSNKFLEVASLVAVQPFDEAIYKSAVLECGRHSDDDQDDDDLLNNDEDAEATDANTTATGGVREMISSLVFA